MFEISSDWFELATYIHLSISYLNWNSLYRITYTVYGGPGGFLYIFWTVRAWSTILDRWLFLKGPDAHFFHPLFRKYPYFSTLEAPNAPRAWPKPFTINSQNDPQLLGFLKRYYTPGLLSPEKSSIFIEFP